MAWVVWVVCGVGDMGGVGGVGGGVVGWGDGARQPWASAARARQYAGNHSVRSPKSTWWVADGPRKAASNPRGRVGTILPKGSPTHLPIGLNLANPEGPWSVVGACGTGGHWLGGFRERKLALGLVPILAMGLDILQYWERGPPTYPREPPTPPPGGGPGDPLLILINSIIY